MRFGQLVAGVALASVSVLAASQEPKKSDNDNKSITVTGCLEGSYLRVHESDSTGSYVERYRLHASKQLMKEMLSKHDNHVLVVTGHVTDVPGTEHAGHTTNIGKKTSVYVGAKDVPVASKGETPTIDVASYTEQEQSCPGKL
jgi:hypothetical protein